MSAYTIRPLSDTTFITDKRHPGPFNSTWGAFAHPDRNRGSRTGWDQVEQAAKVLGLL